MALGSTLSGATTIANGGNALNVTDTGSTSFGGNMGIGTTGPGQPLDVVGNVRLGAASTVGKMLTQPTGTNNMLAVAYRQIPGGGTTLFNTSGNCTVTKGTTGQYTIAFPASSGLSGWT